MSAQASLLLRLEGPWQSWGELGRLTTRETRTHPTKSGVIGLVANALGYERDADLTELAALEFAVRVDRPGTIERDVQTVGSGTMPSLVGDMLADPRLLASPVPTVHGGFQGSPWSYGAPRDVAASLEGRLVSPYPAKGRQTVLTERHYLADAAFVAALGGPHALLETIAAAIDDPARALFLGRRKCVPGWAPMNLGVHAAAPLDALAAVPRLPRAQEGALTAWVESGPGPGAAAVADQPLSFDTHERDYALRYEKPVEIDPPAPVPDAYPDLPAKDTA